jgi:intein/homing endonuclease
MTFKHITNWTKENINFVDTYATTWEASNYWTNKISNETELLASSNSLFNSINSVLSMFGKSFDFSTLESELQKSKYYGELLKEYIFEEIRLTEFPHKPSRKKCIFLVPFEVEIFEFATKLNYNLNSKTLMEIEVIQNDNLHFADLTLLNCNSLSHFEKVKAARQYWQGTTTRDINTEVLYIGEFKINSIIQRQP